MNRLPTNRLEGTRPLKRFCAATLRVHIHLMEKVNCDNCKENRGDHDPCNFLRRGHRLIHCMVHKSPLLA